MRRKPKTRLLSMDECQHRPCEVNGRPAFFHRWVEEDRALLCLDTFTRPEDRFAIADKIRASGVYPAGCHPEVIHETFALVEYQDGTIAMVKPESVRFTDRPPKP